MFQPEAIWGLGIVVLLAVLIWAVLHNRSRNRAKDPMTEAATKAEYDAPRTYARRRDANGS